MSVEHHGNGEFRSEHAEIQQRFLDQMLGKAKREYPAGRMGADDDGVLSYAIASDDIHRTIVIRFGKLVEWIGLDVQSATDLRDQLTLRILKLRGIEMSVDTAKNPVSGGDR